MMPASWKTEIEETIQKTADAQSERQKTENDKNASNIAAAIEALNDTYKTEQKKPEKPDKVKRALDVATVFLLFGTTLFTGLAWWEFRNQVHEMVQAYGPIKQSADAAVASESPYVFTSVPEIEVSTKGKTIVYSFTNYGKTPAILRYYIAQSFNKNSPPTDTQLWTGWEVLRTGESHVGKSIEVRNVLLQTGDATSPDPAKTVTSYFWVEFFYVDVFNFVHTSTATFFYLDDGKSPRYVQLGGEKYNKHHMDKMPDGEWHPPSDRFPKLD